MEQPAVTPEMIEQHGLTPEEYQKIVQMLGRDPNYTELGVFSVMWSEHCCYKNSIALLKTLPNEGEALLTKAGEENAGAVDIGDGLAVVFKIESHNHPSAVEPYQGAATGVGGILRDIFTMGARPIASLDSLRFGSIDNPRVRYLVDGVVRGIGDYGNSFGVPTVAGETYFDKAYTGNPLVNAMAVGVVKTDKMIMAKIEGEDNPVMIVGSKTGRDGIHGATFASEELSEESESKRPSVQIGDPFTEKLLLEATLEIIDEDLVVGVQDMGAAGITCCCSEMSFRGDAGVTIEAGKVPVREEGMTPYEILLSESQERMLVCVKKGLEDEVRKIFDKWELDSTIIGYSNTSGNFKVLWEGEMVVDIPSKYLALGGETPVYHRETKRPDYMDKLNQLDFESFPTDRDWKEDLIELLGSPNICHKGWVFDQYDSMVRTNTSVGPGGDAAVLRIRKSDKALAVKTDCNGRYCYLNPRRGAMQAVAEAARNITCTGGKPVAITNCLNFGNPYKPEIYYGFSEAVAGMGEACKAFGTPVTGGNVSFYNEDPDHAVFPTPTIGMVGIIDDLKDITTPEFKDDGDLIYLIGENKNELGASQYIRSMFNMTVGPIPELNLEREKETQGVLLEAIRAGLIKSAHDISDGGLAVALAECCLINRDKIKGAKIKLDEPELRPDCLLFGEAQSRIIISIDKENKDELIEMFQRQNIPLTKVGVVEGDNLVIEDFIEIPLERLEEAYYESMKNYLARA